MSYRKTIYNGEISSSYSLSIFDQKIINLAKRQLNTHKKICNTCNGKGYIAYKKYSYSHGCDKCDGGYIFFCKNGYTELQLFEACTKLQIELDNCKLESFKAAWWANQALKRISHEYNLPLSD